MSWKRWLVVLATILASTTQATPARADEATATAAPTAAVVTGPNKALLITGASMFVTTYALTASFAGAGRRASDRDLFVPVAGPFMNLANRNCARGCVTTTGDTALLITSGVLQNVGAALMILSAFIPDKVPAARITAGSVSMQLAPTGGAGSGGLGAIGTF